ncbi:MAG: N-acetylneuraminate synthase family protein [Chthoniobacteraceae bacterium]
MSAQFAVGSRVVGDGAPPFILVEMSCSHEGDAARAKTMIDAAAHAGADGIQLQIFSRAEQMPPQHELFGLLGKLEFSHNTWRDIVAHARASGLAVFVFTYDLPSLRFAAELGVDGFKLSSADLSNPELLAAAARTGLPITVGTGASTIDEIQSALATLREAGATKLVLMHGVQNFPTEIADANIARIGVLRRVFGLPVGYQDHTAAALPIARVIDLVALGLGACIIEKHITIDRAEKGTDHQAALEPAEWIEFVKTMRAGIAALGDGGLPRLTESDLRYRQFQKRSIVAARDLPAGAKLQREDVKFLRLDKTKGVSPDHFAAMQGRITRRAITAFEPIREADLAD